MASCETCCEKLQTVARAWQPKLGLQPGGRAETVTKTHTAVTCVQIRVMTSQTGTNGTVTKGAVSFAQICAHLADTMY